ncbi:MAG TPA: hypothetical protein VH309_07445, partial [Elusimicrobiota bacterium]|nr:hypothetical protein [Elusimicrobiota bacterium]
MRAAAWALAPLVLLAGACVPDIDIARDTTLSGHLTARTFRVEPGVVVSAGGDLIVDSRGPATIEGSIRGEVASGASIRIRVSSGDCVVDGDLEGGSGADGEDPGQDGEPGGGVRLRADRGEVLVRGELSGGDGGDGVGLLRQGRGAVKAVSGAGGSGGDVELLGASIDLSAPASAGEGGAGGAAFAQVFDLAPGAADVVNRGESLASEEEDDFVDQPLPAAGSAEAVARAG